MPAQVEGGVGVADRGPATAPGPAVESSRSGSRPRSESSGSRGEAGDHRRRRRWSARPGRRTRTRRRSRDGRRWRPRARTGRRRRRRRRGDRQGRRRAQAPPDRDVRVDVDSQPIVADHVRSGPGRQVGAVGRQVGATARWRAPRVGWPASPTPRHSTESDGQGVEARAQVGRGGGGRSHRTDGSGRHGPAGPGSGGLWRRATAAVSRVRPVGSRIRPRRRSQTPRRS